MFPRFCVALNSIRLRIVLFNVMGRRLSPGTYLPLLWTLCHPRWRDLHPWKSMSSASMMEMKHSMTHGTVQHSVYKHTGNNVVNRRIHGGSSLVANMSFSFRTWHIVQLR